MWWFKKKKVYTSKEIVNLLSESYYAGAGSMLEIGQAVQARIEKELRVSHKHLLTRFMEEVKRSFVDVVTPKTAKKAILRALKDHEILTPVVEELND